MNNTLLPRLHCYAWMTNEDMKKSNPVSEEQVPCT